MTKRGLLDMVPISSTVPEKCRMKYKTRAGTIKNTVCRTETVESPDTGIDFAQ